MQFFKCLNIKYFAEVFVLCFRSLTNLFKFIHLIYMHSIYIPQCSNPIQAKLTQRNPEGLSCILRTVRCILANYMGRQEVCSNLNVCAAQHAKPHIEWPRRLNSSSSLPPSGHSHFCHLLLLVSSLSLSVALLGIGPLCLSC